MHTTARDEGNMVDLGKSEQLKVQVPVTLPFEKNFSSSQKQRSLENEIAEMLAGGIQKSGLTPSTTNKSVFTFPNLNSSSDSLTSQVPSDLGNFADALTDQDSSQPESRQPKIPHSDSTISQ